MATLEDAAEELAARLKGLGSEIEESEHALQQLRGRVEGAGEELEEEWSHLTEAVSAFLVILGQVEEQLAVNVRDALQATTDAAVAVREDCAETGTAIADGQAQASALFQHATALLPGVESLVTEAGEQPAQRLASQVKEVEAQLAKVVDEAREFLEEDVVTSLTALAEEAGERCRALRSELAEVGGSALQAVFEDWEGKVGELEQFVSSQGFLASHAHARAVVSWSLEQCQNAAEASLDALKTLLDEAVRPLQDLSTAVEALGVVACERAAALTAELDGSREAAGGAASALSAVRILLASYSFVEA